MTARFYSGAVRTCDTCGGNGWDAEPHPVTGEAHNPSECPECEGGWVPVDITETWHKWEVAGQPADGVRQCAHCDQRLTRYEGVVRPGCPQGNVHAFLWAYPQPGDWVLVDAAAIGTAVVQITGCDTTCPDGTTYTFNESRFDGAFADDLRLIVDRPNPSRIPGTEPPV